MGAIAEAIAAYAQPLLDQTDGSLEQMNRALMISQLCWNLALLPKGERDSLLRDIRATLHMDDGEFEAFQRSVVIPMIQRHQEMFPRLHRHSRGPAVVPEASRRSTHTERYPGTARNAPCPCKSGKKYKRCCGR